MAVSVFFSNCTGFTYSVTFFSKGLFPSVVALLVLVCFKAISHIVTRSIGHDRVQLGLVYALVLWAHLFIFLSFCFSLYFSVSFIYSSVFLFGCVMTFFYTLHINPSIHPSIGEYVHANHVNQQSKAVSKMFINHLINCHDDILHCSKMQMEMRWKVHLSLD